MARSARQFSISPPEEDAPCIVRIKVTARSTTAAAAPAAAAVIQRTASEGSPRIGSLRPGPATPTAVGFTPDADPLGFRSRLPGSPLDRLASTGSLSSSYGSKDMEEDVLAAIEGLTSALHIVDQPGYLAAPGMSAAAAAAGGGAAPAASKRPASAKKRSSFRRAAGSRLAMSERGQ